MKSERTALFFVLLSLLCACDKERTRRSEVEFQVNYAKADFAPSDKISVYHSGDAAVFDARNVISATSAVFGGRISTSGNNRLVAVYPAAPVSGGNAQTISLAHQTMGETCDYACGSITDPAFTGQMTMKMDPLTSRSVLNLKNISDFNLKIASVTFESTKMFYSTCDFAASAVKNTYSDCSLTVETGGLALGTGATVQIPFYMFPGEIATSKVTLIIDLKDEAGKAYQVRYRADYTRPKAGNETSLDFSIAGEMLDDSPKDFTIVYPKSLTGAPLEGIGVMQDVIKAVTGLTLKCVSDDTPESEYEILFGETNRTAGKAVVCPADAYVIKYANKKLVVKGSSDDQLIAALYGLERSVLGDNSYASEGRLQFNVNLDLVVETGETLAMRHMINRLYDFTIKAKLLKSISGGTDTYVAQGACTDGTFAYLGYRTSDESKAVLLKYRLSDLTQVSSMTLDLSGLGGYCHINDLVYEPDSDLIYVSTWSNKLGSIKQLITVKASTMVQQASKTGISHSPTAICFNTKTKTFLSRSGTKVYKSAAGFTGTQVVNSAYDNYGYTNQGGGGDDLYAYFPVNNGTNSQLLTFDWDGNQLWNVQINNKIESESLFVVDDKYYWWCYGSKQGHLYLLTPVLRYTYRFKGGWSDIASPALK